MRAFPGKEILGDPSVRVETLHLQKINLTWIHDSGKKQVIPCKEVQVGGVGVCGCGVEVLHGGEFAVGRQQVIANLFLNMLKLLVDYKPVSPQCSISVYHFW